MSLRSPAPGAPRIVLPFRPRRGVLAVASAWLVLAGFAVRPALALPTTAKESRSAASTALMSAAGRLLDRPGVGFAGVRVLTAVTVTAVACDAIHPPAGASRRGLRIPDPGELLETRSTTVGGAAMAFAAAMALDREARSPWVRWIVYPAAGAAAWSLGRGDRDAGLDAVGGMALGLLMTSRVETVMHPSATPLRVGTIVQAHRQSVRLGARIVF
jgi:hypothetical protein